MTKLACQKAVLDDARLIEDVTIEIENGRILAINEGLQTDAEQIEGWTVPGFVDTHSHGGAGADFTDPDPDRVRAGTAMHLQHGTTTLFASTVTEPIDELCEQIQRLRGFIAEGLLAGIHLEGPFMSPAKKGAHREWLLIDPELPIVERLLDAGQGDIKMVTMAPEWPSGIDATRAFTEAGVTVAFGHSDADEAITKHAMAAGANVTTHLFNAMRPIHHREPGPIPALLDHAEMNVELICDGVHVHADVVAMAIDAAGVDRVLLVTDAMSATGAADGEYSLGGLPVRVVDGTAKLINEDGSLGAIAGSTLTMDRAFSFIVQQVGRSIVDAVKMASINPARVHRLTEVGQLSVGRYADVCVVDDKGTLQRVMRRGEWV